MEDVDDATLDVILALQLQDIAHLQGHYEKAGIDPKGTIAATHVYRDELEKMISRLRDHRIGVAFGESEVEDLEDHAVEPIIAPGLDTSGTPASLDLRGTSNNVASEENSDTAVVGDQSDHDSSDEDGTEVTSTVDETEHGKARAEEQPSTQDEPNTCVVCQDDLPPERLQVPCGDSYCYGCARRLFHLSMKDDSLFPPRCCGKDIPFTTVQHLFDQGSGEVFRRRQVELSTTDRTYCSDQACSAFIEVEHVANNRATCPSCGLETCIICKGQAHEGEDCAQDPAVIALMALAETEGMKQCHSCRRLVEISFGCNHMTYVSTTSIILQETPRDPMLTAHHQMPLQIRVLLRMRTPLEELHVRALHREPSPPPGAADRRARRHRTGPRPAVRRRGRACRTTPPR